MIRGFLNILLSFLIWKVGNPVFSLEIEPQSIEKYTLTISNKFSKTYCNTIQFGISEDGALKFSIGETNKEFLNRKLNKFIDKQFLNKNILLNLEKKCQIHDFPVEELDNLVFK